ncbi:CaiB/BaiF CoA transferase family protein [Antricoccus suffuscus]|uniref:CaiB/BaiF CoA transferase family protein n=1 Tax=Antricoccus suffuscus TaxID=1629062 RepID=UPI00192DE578|nr:CoA transferase [Antricoccus suffuscus]
MKSKKTGESADVDEDLSRPLTGVRVLEFGHVAAGPFAASLLADLGADVVKVEPPSGDQMRSWPPLVSDERETFSHNFASVNRNKRSVTANLKDPKEFAEILALTREADVIVENYRPGALDRLGLGFDAVSHGHKGMVYCSISGFGLNSPYVSNGAYDVVIQGMSGLMSITGEPGGKPVKAGVPVADFISGLYGAYTIAALLPKVRGSGHSARIDCPMLDCLLGASALQTSEYWGSHKEPLPLGSAHPRNAPYQAYQASDRDFIVAAGSHKLWLAVCDVTDLEHLADDPRFVDQEHRAANQVALAEVLQERFSNKPASAWVTELSARGVPASLVNSFGDILADSHITATQLVQDVDVPVAGPTPMVVFPARIGEHPSKIYNAPPRLGEHNHDVFREWTES